MHTFSKQKPGIEKRIRFQLLANLITHHFDWDDITVFVHSISVCHSHQRPWPYALSSNTHWANKIVLCLSSLPCIFSVRHSHHSSPLDAVFRGRWHHRIWSQDRVLLQKDFQCLFHFCFVSFQFSTLIKVHNRTHYFEQGDFIVFVRTIKSYEMFVSESYRLFRIFNYVWYHFSLPPSSKFTIWRTILSKMTSPSLFPPPSPTTSLCQKLASLDTIWRIQRLSKLSFYVT